MACSQYLTAVVNYSFCVCRTFGGVMASSKELYGTFEVNILTAVVNYSFCACSMYGVKSIFESSCELFVLYM